MEGFTLGFLGIVVFSMLTKWMMEWKIYKKSIYSLIYSNFTEFRMKRKSINKMSESMKLNEIFGTARLLYHVLKNRKYKPYSYVTILLESGFYVIGISQSSKISNGLFHNINSFVKENITIQLKNTIYENKSVPVHILLLTSESKQIASKAVLIERNIVNRVNLLDVIYNIHNITNKTLTKEDINHIYQILAKEALNEENSFALENA